MSSVQYKVQGGSPEGTLAWVAKQAKPTPMLWCVQFSRRFKVRKNCTGNKVLLRNPCSALPSGLPLVMNLKAETPGSALPSGLPP